MCSVHRRLWARGILVCTIMLLPGAVFASGAEARRHFLAHRYDAALSLAQQAAAHGDALAMLVLGLIYLEGKGSPKDKATAFKWMTASAEKGNCKAQSNLGFMTRAETGMAKQLVKAARWYRLSADQNCASGYRGLAEMHERGEYFLRNSREALELYEKSEELFRRDLAEDPDNSENLNKHIAFVGTRIRALKPFVKYGDGATPADRHR